MAASLLEHDLPELQGAISDEERLLHALGSVRDAWEDAREHFRREREQRILENKAFFDGLQWAIPQELGTRQFGYALDPNERPETANLVDPTVRSAVASKLRQGMPNPEAVPATTDIRARAKARACQMMARSFLRNGVYRFEELYRAVLDAEICGLAWQKVYWDPLKGKLRPTGEIDARGRPIKKFEGEIEVEFVDCFDAIPDAPARRPQEIRYVCHRKVMPIARAYDAWPLDFFGRDTAEKWSGHTSEWEPIGRDRIEGGGVRTEYGTRDNQLVEVIEYWERPTNRYPNGRLIIWSGDILIEWSDGADFGIGLPYAFPWVPIYGSTIKPSSLYPRGVPHNVKGPQRTLNIALSLQREWAEMGIAPAVLNPTNSGIPQEHFQNIAGAILEYNPGGKPEWWTPDPMPAALGNYAVQSQELIQQTSTFSDQGRGQNPTDLSGRAIALLEQREHGINAPNVKLFSDQINEVLMLCLHLARDMYDEGRVLLVFGENNKPLAFEFKRDSIDFDAWLVLEPYSGKPNSRALRYAEALDALGAGGLEDTPGAIRFRKLVEMDVDDASTIDADQRHRQRAWDEQIAFMNAVEAGLPPDQVAAVLRVLGADRHEIHLDEDEIFVISAEFLALPPWAQEIYLMHDEEHEIHLGMQSQDFAAQQSMLTNPSQGVDGGAPPEKAPGIESPMDGGHEVYPREQIQAADAAGQQAKAAQVSPVPVPAGTPV